MKKLLSTLTFTFISLAAMSAASAASSPVYGTVNTSGSHEGCSSEVSAAIADNKLALIDQIVARNPRQAGSVASCLLWRAQSNSRSNPEKAGKLFLAAAPYAGQISSEDAATADYDIRTVVAMADRPSFQRAFKKEAGDIFSTALNFLAQPALVNQDPNLQAVILADANNYLTNNPGADKPLADQVLLAQGGDLNGANPDLSVNRIRERSGIAGSGVSSGVTIPAGASPTIVAVGKALTAGNPTGVDQIVAKNPSQTGPVALYLLDQAKANVNTNPDLAVKLYKEAMPFAAQISASDAPQALAGAKAVIALANDPIYQARHPKEAGDIFSAALGFLELPNIANQDPHARSVVLAEAGDYLNANPNADGGLREDVSLAMGSDLFGVNPDLSVIRIKERTKPPSSPAVSHPSAE